MDERNDNKGKDTFDLSDWWKSNCTTLPAFKDVFRTVLTNSCPPQDERLFTSFNKDGKDYRFIGKLTTFLEFQKFI